MSNFTVYLHVMKKTLLKKNILILSTSLLFLAACSSGKYAATNKIYKEQANDFGKTLSAIPPLDQQVAFIAQDQQTFIGSVNFGIRKPNYVILHHTAQNSTDQTIKTFILKSTQTSAHYIVGRDGKLIQMVNDYLRSNHAGVAKWGNETDLNSSSIGIELDNDGIKDPYTEAQINTLLALLTNLKKKYNIPTANFIGHSDIAPKRKIDPNNFPWKQLADKGFGLWYDAVMQIPPPDFDFTVALRIIGYDVSNKSAAIVAFKRHFVQTDITPVLTDSDKMILFNLYKKYL